MRAERHQDQGLGRVKPEQVRHRGDRVLVCTDGDGLHRVPPVQISVVTASTVCRSRRAPPYSQRHAHLAEAIAEAHDILDALPTGLTVAPSRIAQSSIHHDPLGGVVEVVNCGAGRHALPGELAVDPLPRLNLDASPYRHVIARERLAAAASHHLGFSNQVARRISRWLTWVLLGHGRTLRCPAITKGSEQAAGDHPRRKEFPVGASYRRAAWWPLGRRGAAA